MYFSNIPTHSSVTGPETELMLLGPQNCSRKWLKSGCEIKLGPMAFSAILNLQNTSIKADDTPKDSYSNNNEHCIFKPSVTGSKLRVSKWKVQTTLNKYFFLYIYKYIENM
jgi:hypothetical protein